MELSLELTVVGALVVVKLIIWLIGPLSVVAGGLASVCIAGRSLPNENSSDEIELFDGRASISFNNSFSNELSRELSRELSNSKLSSDVGNIRRGLFGVTNSVETFGASVVGANVENVGNVACVLVTSGVLSFEFPLISFVDSLSWSL